MGKTHATYTSAEFSINDYSTTCNRMRESRLMWVCFNCSKMLGVHAEKLVAKIDVQNVSAKSRNEA